MNPFLMYRGERLAHWKTFRGDLPAHDEAQQLQMVADYWAKAPLMKQAYDSELLEEWPGPWDMINAGDWCRDSVAVGMEFTLRLAGWSADRLHLTMIRDYDLSDQMLTLKIDNSTLLNYSIGEVVLYPDTHKDILFEYCFKGRGYTTL